VVGVRLGWRDAVGPLQIAEIADRIDKAGFCELHGYLDPEDLRELADLAGALSQSAGGEYISVTGTKPFAGTAWEHLASSRSVRALCESLYRYALDRDSPGAPYHQVFRCLKGPSSRGHSYYFHFDSYVLTLLIPIVIPSSGARGDLLILPGLRPFRKSYWRNVLDKFVAELTLTQLLLKALARRGRFPVRSVALTPGSAVLFWGYRSLHANEPCAPDQLRSTALLHFGDYHREAQAVRQAG
jgi:hypothetical protein